MKCVFKDRTFYANLPKNYEPIDGEMWEAVNEDTGDETLVVVKRDGPQGGGCSGCIASTSMWSACNCTNISCGNYNYILIDINSILEEL